MVSLLGFVADVEGRLSRAREGDLEVGLGCAKAGVLLGAEAPDRAREGIALGLRGAGGEA